MKSQLIARYLAGNCSSDDLIEVQQWLEQDRENRQLMEEYERIWEASESRQEASVESFSAEEDWNSLQQRIASEPAKISGRLKGGNAFSAHLHSRMGQMLRIAAVLMIATLLGIVAYQNLYSPPAAEPIEPTLREIVTNRGQQANLILSDGTKVQLNADSKIRLPDVFQAGKREVFLEGEAFFDVAKNPDKPFLIHSKAAQVRVLGTSLGIRSYPEDKIVQVVVKEGRVSLSRSGEKKDGEAILTPGEVGRIDLADYNITTEKIDDLEVLLSWTDGYLKFKDTPMSEVALQLERKYDIDVESGSREIEDMRLTAVLKSRSIRNVLDVISTSLGIEYEMDQQKAVFKEK